MAWPTPQDYNEAVQNPRLAFTDADLRGGQPELTRLGLPRPISGAFACVYKMHSGGRQWAARCFLTDVPDQQQRYAAISTHLATAGLPYTVPFSYLANGIKVQGTVYPLLKMEWVQGESLSTFVARAVGRPNTLIRLAKIWAQMVADLQATNIAHGDLQHGNILVVGDQLRLIDYDGMFVPGLAGKVSREFGHRNYQHPARTEYDYGPYLDNFSAWVIYLSLIALTVHPELWRSHRGGDECLLFRKEDFVEPDSSQLFRVLSRSPNGKVRALTQLFMNLVAFSPQDVPSLDGSYSPEIAVISLATGSNLQSGGWWQDHVDTPIPQPPLPEARHEPVERSPSPGLGWVFDVLDEGLLPEAVEFQSSIRHPRRLLVTSCLLVIIVSALCHSQPAVIVITSTGICGLNLLLCFLRYRKDQSVTEFARFKAS